MLEKVDPAVCRISRQGDVLAAVGRTGTKQIDPEGKEQFCAASDGMSAAMEIAEAVESFDGQGQHGKEPADQ